MIQIQIKASEGGNDSKLLVEDMYNIYRKACNLNNFEIKNIQWLSSTITFTVAGDKTYEFFLQEKGSHVWIRIPPTEKKGRIQTSVITVAISKAGEDIEFEIDRSEVERWFTRGTGNGGQNRNKVETVVVLKHIPTGIMVKCQEHRTQGKNEERAWEILKAKLEKIYLKNYSDKIVSEKREQIGSGERSDKRRTYREKEDLAIDHITGKSTRLKDIWKGKISILHK